MLNNNVQVSKESEWLAIKRMSQQLLEYAKNQKWIELKQLEKQRESAFTCFFSDLEAINHISTLSQDISEMIELNDEIAALCAKERNSVQKKIHALRNGRTAKRVYEEELHGI